MNRVDALEFLTGLHIAESGSEIFPLIQSSTFDWIPVIEIAGMKYVAPMIYIKLRNLGLLDDCPADVVDYLTIIYELNCDRNENAVRQTSEIILLLNNNGYIP
ncbi:MAG: hypothetical protein GWN00_31650, partial [Aliifodinibius sp.]|nr:nucleotidyltransferase family protein [Fodinibius sp.]NIW48225.1 hypothetical protein [Gammaproteobacteria bacterium]NIX58736.1 hypothetical protein [candidate division Zixibacteria bacterium]NIY29178.1 hypothetical protein [Fodinibius sp.]